MIVGGARISTPVVEVLREQGRELVVANDTEDVESRGSARSAAAIVMLAEEPGAALPGALTRLAKVANGAPVVLVCGSMAGWEVRAALAAGVSGIVVAEEVHAALHPCLVAVVAGQICIPRRNVLHVEPPALSSREKQILGLVVMGDTNGEIARRLFLAESTVKSHLSSAFAKLGVHSRNEAADLILDPELGLSSGILALGAEPVQYGAADAR